MKCYIVLVPVENRFVGRKECEKIENMVFNIKGNENTLKARSKLDSTSADLEIVSR